MARPKKTIIAVDDSMSATKTDIHSGEITPSKVEKKFPEGTPQPENLMKSKNEQVVQKRHVFMTIAEQLAEDHTWIGNYRIPADKKLYPHDKDAAKRFVSRIFPYAKGGPLYVDEPRNEHQEAWALERQKHLHSLGYRHVVIPMVTNAETLHNVASQLQNVKKQNGMDHSSNRS